MKKTLFFILMLLCLSVVAATKGNDDKTCGGGDQRPPHRDSNEYPGGGQDFAGATSIDPNEIIGPQGYDSLQWVSINDVLNYTIYFENDPEFATANAQRVDVRFAFSKKELMKDFILGTYGFANMSWNIDDATNTYQNRLNLVDTMQIYVDLIAGLDVTKKQAFWKFSSIDPETGFAPWQHDRGMLPVNDSTHVGEGFVQFSLKPVSTMKTGDTISIAANIVFDQNDTIPTNRWKNVIDAGAPSSKVIAAADAENPRIHHLTFEAVDDEGGAGVKQVRLFLANQFGVFEEYGVYAADSIVDFETEVGRKYEFYSLAEDNVGNREPLKEKADIVLNNNLAPTDILLSAESFQDDIAEGGFIAEISSVDTEENGTFTYELAEGEGAIHNDLFLVEGSQLKAKNTFKCADVNEYKIRLSSTDEGGLSFSKAFVLNMKNVLEKPEPDTLDVVICHDETFVFHGVEYSNTGMYNYSESNDYMCDSLFVINLTVLPQMDAPLVTVEGDYTLVSSSENNNQWFKEDGIPIADATEQRFTPTEDGIYYVAIKNGKCYSEPSMAYRVQVSNNYTLAMNLNNGWNWISSNLSDDKYKSARSFIEPLGEAVDRLVGFESEIIRDPKYGLTGSLNDLKPQEGYLLKTHQLVDNSWEGNSYDPSENPIALKKGWNWIGYIPTYSNSIEGALSLLTPSEGDVIKDYTDFATYEGGKWIGTIAEMKPGVGYMYYSKQNTSFTYPTKHVFPVSIDSEAKRLAGAYTGNTWSMDANDYPYNMNIIAEGYIGTSKAPAGLYTIGAFVDDECRGVGKLVDGKVFLTVYGDTDHSTVRFKAKDNATDQEYVIKENISFVNTLVASVASPYHLTIDISTGIDGVCTSGYNIYPNPVRERMFINGDVGSIKTVTVVDLSGAKIIKAEGYNTNGIDMTSVSPGTYVVVINTNQGIYVEKIIKSAY